MYSNFHFILLKLDCCDNFSYNSLALLYEINGVLILAFNNESALYEKPEVNPIN